MQSISPSDNWEFADWKGFHKVLFRLQRRIFKAVKDGDKAKAKRLQKLVLSSRSARMLAIRQVTQLNTGKKTAGIDGKKSLTFKERFQLEETLNSTDGFDFLGWHFFNQKGNGKFKSTPSTDNFKAFRQKVKHIVNNSNYGAETKVSKLAPIVRGWRNYHKYCKMEGSRFNLWHSANRTFKVFLKQKTINRYQAEGMVR